MKFMSDFKELEGKIFNSINECKDAESKVLKDREAIAEKEKDKSKLKKKLSNDIEKAEEKVKQAYADYEAAKEQAAKIIEESNKQALDVINPAKQAIKDAEANKVAAIKAFNEACGPYQKVYTGEKAQAEFDRLNKQFNSMLSDFFKLWW